MADARFYTLRLFAAYTPGADIIFEIICVMPPSFIARLSRRRADFIIFTAAERYRISASPHAFRSLSARRTTLSKARRLRYSH